VINAWIILDKGIALFKVVAVAAFMLGGILLTVVFERDGLQGN
jgi:hypothetical protein